MLWPLVCGIIYLLLSMRIIVDLVLDISDRHRGVRLRLRAWGMHLYVKRPIAGRISRRNAGARAKRLKKSWTMIRAVLRAIHWGQADIHIRVGLGEAAQTAMIAGGAYAGISALQAVAGRSFPMEVHIEPDFRTSCFVLVGRCIFSLVPGDIMFAVLLAAVKKTRREGFRWKSIRLKA